MQKVLRVFYSDHYTLPLPEGHRFPMVKYRMLRDLLLSEGILQSHHLQESPLARPETLSLAHDPKYIQDMAEGTVEKGIIQRIGFPWSLGLFQRSCATVGGALGAALSALENGFAGNLAGGTHHAHFDRGEGYCVFNDIAVASRFLLQNGYRQRIAIIDLDVHQGNGNSSILSQDPRIFILSLHGEKNYPFKKVPSTLDIGLPDGAGDEEFLKALDQALPQVMEFRPDFIFYQMGVDPLKEDLLGKLNMTFEGLKERDRRVLTMAAQEKIPLSLALGGGYAKPIDLSVRAYANTYQVAREIFTDLDWS
ncbi:MAG: histone deacetylase [Pseudobdellovibrionaceae bacterium]